eukprot:scaffold69013_cov27-Tisochrysis_lutea.AAC.2
MASARRHSACRPLQHPLQPTCAGAPATNQAARDLRISLAITISSGVVSLRLVYSPSVILTGLPICAMSCPAEDQTSRRFK